METFIRLVEVAVVPISVAVIGVGGTFLFNRLRQENTSQHAEGRELLKHLSGQVGGIDSKVDRLDERLDNVQSWQSEHEITHLTDL
jgi:hypothetical protein